MATVRPARGTGKQAQALLDAGALVKYRKSRLEGRKEREVSRSGANLQPGDPIGLDRLRGPMRL